MLHKWEVRRKTENLKFIMLQFYYKMIDFYYSLFDEHL